MDNTEMGSAEKGRGEEMIIRNLCCARQVSVVCPGSEVHPQSFNALNYSNEVGLTSLLPYLAPGAARAREGRTARCVTRWSSGGSKDETGRCLPYSQRINDQCLGCQAAMML